MPRKTGTARNKLKLTKEYSLTFLSPWKHARAREEKTRRNTIRALVGLYELAVLEEVDLVNGMDQDWIDDRSEPEMEFEPEAEQTHEQELTNLRVLEWLHDLPTDPKETILTIQDVDKDGIKYVSHDNTESNWVAPDGPLRVPQSNLNLLGLTHTKNLIIKKLKSARETGELETEGENAKKLPFGRIFEILTYRTIIQTISS